MRSVRDCRKGAVPEAGRSGKGRSVPRLPIALAALLALPGWLSPPAAAISRKQATRVALRALQPERERGLVVVFALRTRLAAGALVAEAGARPRGSERTPVAGKTWLFWEDRAYQALFEHPSRLLLVDSRGGRVIRRRDEHFFPLINGVRPAFLRSV